MPDRTVLTRYDYYAGAKPLGNVWAMKRGELALRCALATHSLGWELRLTAGSNFLRSHVCKTEDEVFDVSDAWRNEAAGKGWS